MKKQKGSIVVFALMILSFVLISAFSIAAVTLVERRSAGASVNSSTAFQNADKGMEEFLQQLYKEMDQNDTLNDLGIKLNTVYGGSGYVCDDAHATATIGANLGSDETAFIITAFREIGDADDAAGWRSTSLIPIDDCDTPLADVARFKATGNFNNAARAVFLKLRDSLTRGLVAQWSFEDRAQIARVTIDAGKKNSMLAQDASKQSQILTLCKLMLDEESIEVSIDVGEDDPEVYDLKEFTECLHDLATGMNPFKGYDDDTAPEYRANGAWVEGIVEEDVTLDDPVPSDLSTDEALYFDGTTYLAMYVDESCADDVINCIDTDDEDELQLEDDIAISMWIKADRVVGTQYLLSRRDTNLKQYNLYLDNDEVCFEVSNTKLCDGEITVDEWHHVVGRSSAGGKLSIWIDAEQVGTPTNVPAIGSPKNTLFIGASDLNNDATIENFFQGAIDDVRVWNRALTNGEIWRLCTEAEAEDGSTDKHPEGCPSYPAP